jgi:subtilisin family serine protease
MDNLTRFGVRRDRAAAWRRALLVVALGAVAGSEAAAQLLDPPIQVPGTIGGPLERALPPLRDRLDPIETVEDAAETVDDELDEGLEGVQDTVESATEAVEEIVGAVGELFVADADPAGQEIEREVWVVLVPAEYAPQIPGWGFTIRERRELEGLDLVLLRIEAPEGRGMRETELDISSGAPGTVVDYNHVYGAGADEPGGGLSTVEAASVPVHDSPASAPSLEAGGLTIGIVDSSVVADHEALHGATIVQKDFVPFAGERPTSHGTAVASILVEGARASAAGALRVYAASVFVAGEDHESMATTGSLVAALEWLGAQGAGVINMSLTGPANRVLEAALAAITKRGALVVAAVGNEGPASKPLYPAAYDTVLGITAVDSDNRIYRHANRGRHVAFAAPGVRAKVARSDGGYGRETGTSMAAPFAAAIIATSLAADSAAPADVVARLEQNAVDLGDEGFDEVFGFGLIAPLRR